MQLFARRTFSLALALLAAVTGAARAAEAEDEANLVKATLLADVDAAAPGMSFALGVRMTIAPHWHTYWANPGDSGRATRLKLSGPEGFTFGAIQWPLPSRIEIDGTITFGYEGEVLLLIPVTVAKDAKAGEAKIEADVNWLACKESCVEGGAKLSIGMPVRADAKPANAELFAAWRDKLPIPRDEGLRPIVYQGIVQDALPDGSPAPELEILWKEPVRKVEWFPLANRAVAVQNIAVRHEAKSTKVTYTTRIYKPDEIPDGALQCVVVFEDAAGKRRGVTTSFGVLKKSK